MFNDLIVNVYNYVKVRKSYLNFKYNFNIYILK